MFALLLSGCFHFESPHSGVVLDADTKEPIEGVIVFRELERICYLPPNPGGPSHEYQAHNEVLTDKDGHYTLPIDVSFMPPLACLTDMHNEYYVKDGYFSKNTDSGNIAYLYPMTHYLHFRPYIKDYESFFSFIFREKSELVKKSNLAKLKYRQLEKADETGVFFRMPGKKFTRIAVASGRNYFFTHKEMFSGTFYFAYDELGKEWITIDGRGKLVAALPKDSPKFEYISFDEDNRPYFATSNEIVYMADSNYSSPVDIFYKHPYTMNKINPHKGDITAITSDNNGPLYTIEGNGKILCQYGIYDGKANKSSTPHFLAALEITDLPDVSEGDFIKQATFKYIMHTMNVNYPNLYIVAKTNKYWHIYTLTTSWANLLDKSNLTKIYSIPVEKEITAFATNGSSLFIAYKDEGLKSYTIMGLAAFTYKKIDPPKIKESAKFYNKAKTTNALNIASIIWGNAISEYNVIYFVTGDDKIYRLAADGTPDFIVKADN